MPQPLLTTSEITTRFEELMGGLGGLSLKDVGAILLSGSIYKEQGYTHPECIKLKTAYFLSILFKTNIYTKLKNKLRQNGQFSFSSRLNDKEKTLNEAFRKPDPLEYLKKLGEVKR